MSEEKENILNDEDVFTKKQNEETSSKKDEGKDMEDAKENTNDNVENKEDKENVSENDNSEKKESTNNNSEDEKKTDAKEDDTNWKEKYIRLLAEFDNFRKRTDKEKEQMIGFGESMILGKFLPLVDNMERASSALTEEDKKTSMGEGLDKIMKQLQKLFEELDIKPIEAVGKKFDPEFHNAVMTDEESDVEADTITEELQKGYTFKGEVLRHTMVKVKK